MSCSRFVSPPNSANPASPTELWEEERLGHGQSLSDIVTRVPLILRLPAALAQEAGRRISHPVELVDIVPTILDILDLPQPEGLDGRRLLAPRGDPDRILFSNLVLAGYELRAARQYPFKLVRDMVTGEDRLLDLNAGGGVLVATSSIPLPYHSPRVRSRFPLPIRFRAGSLQRGGFLQR